MMATRGPNMDLPITTTKCGGPRRTHTRITFSRHRLVEIAHETLKIADQGSYVNDSGRTVDVSAALDEAKTQSVHYHFEHTFDAPSESLVGRYDTNFVVKYGSPLEVASNLRGDRVGLLNSASAKNPGGRIHKGTLSQEDCLCRASLLYPCLFQYYGRRNYYYDVNLSPPHNGTTSSTCAIFSPRVPVIRRDTVEAPLLDEPRYVSFVSIPATNAFTHGKSPDEDASPEAEYEARKAALREDMSDRIRRALSIFAEHGLEELVLGAFGCGVHGNDPYMVASIFEELLGTEFRGVFRTVVFAIQPSRHGNYMAFTKYFGQQKS